jgi:putative chitinase
MDVAMMFRQEVAAAADSTVPGYGVKYKGHGIFQLTGYDNYVQYTKYTGIDLVTNPKRAAEPDLSVYIACEFWERKGLTALALKDDVVAVTKKINGGSNGLDERKMYLSRIKGWMGIR